MEVTVLSVRIEKKLPRFTAEASLRRDSRNISRAYVGAANGRRKNLHSRVVPALPTQLNGNGGPPTLLARLAVPTGGKPVPTTRPGKRL